MGTLKELIKYSANDKVQHYIWWYAGSLTTGIFCSNKDQMIISILFWVAMAALKEYWDSRGNGTSDFMDFISGLGGVGMSYFILDIGGIL